LQGEVFLEKDTFKTKKFIKGSEFRLQISYHKHKLNPILVHYIYHKNDKGKPCEMDLPLLKNDITNILGPQKPVIYSRNHRFRIDDFEPRP